MVSHVAVADGSIAPVSGPPASTPVGRLGEPMNVPRGANAGTNIRGRNFGGHAIDQMQGRGVPPSAVDVNERGELVLPHI